MGDQVGHSVEGVLSYIPYSEFERILSLKVDPEWRAGTFADMCRFNCLYMIARAGSGHIGSSFSSLEILSWLLLEEINPAVTPTAPGDVFFSSKGHDVPGYYAALLGLGHLKFDLIHKLRCLNGLPGHPDIAIPGIRANTGSLGMGISKAKGMVLANRYFNRQGRVFVMTGDGELQEGQFWESLLSAANHNLHEITAIIDHNKLQSDTFVTKVSDLGDLEAKLRSFGWQVNRCNGHDLADFSGTLQALKNEMRPKIIIADTIKGYGVSFMEHTSLDSDEGLYRFHSGAPDADTYQRASQEIQDRLQARLAKAGVKALRVEHIHHERKAANAQGERLLAAYSEALVDQAVKHQNLVALDADLVLDTGLLPFREHFPDRFFECGIAEQDMVSMAGGMALNGLLPVVHSFACFLSSRPNEQIYNNASEKTKILYVGSLAGVVPGGPGHSHQAVRDISALAAVPGLTLIEPSCGDEVRQLLNWCLTEATGSCYLRLCSLPWDIPYQLPKDYQPKLGQGITLVEGSDVVVIAYGPVLLSAAVEAAEIIAKKRGQCIKVVNLPWLNTVDSEWLKKVIAGCQQVLCLDNHYVIGGQGDIIAKTLAQWPSNNVCLHQRGLSDFPPCGTNMEVLREIHFDVQSLVKLIEAFLK